MKTAIFSLYQKKEFDRCVVYIQNIKHQLNINRQLLILINDQYDVRLEKFCKSISPYIIILCCNENLGVAGGRNYLLKYALAKNYNFFISNDNDIIYEKTYFDKIEYAYKYLKLNNDNVGMVQPILLNGNDYKNFLNLGKAHTWKEVNTLNIKRYSFKDLLIYNTYQKFVETVYHAGISNIWVAHFGEKYFKDENFDLNEFQTNFYSILADKNKFIKLLKNKQRFLKIATTAGGISAFDKEFIEGNGFYNNKFNPFLYEDSEYGFRSYCKKYNNYLLLDTCGIHDIFLTKVNRNILQYPAISRLRGVEIKNKFLNNEQKKLIAKSIFLKSIDGILKNIAKIKDKTSVNIDKLNILYYFNFIYGFLLEKENVQFDIDFIKELFFSYNNIIKKENLLSDTRISISDELDIVIGVFSISNKHTNTFSAYAYNCHFENFDGHKSKYFDMYIIGHFNSLNGIDISLNIQADEFTSALTCTLELNEVFSDNEKEDIFKNFDFKVKKYDFGNFSNEDIYPNPTLESKDLNELVSSLKSMFSLYNSKISKFILATMQWKFPQIIEKKSMYNRKILIFTDSRGQHVPEKFSHQTFPYRLKEFFEKKNYKVELILCPMKWTTTLDFFEYISDKDINNYEHIILYTGIVEWSPRPQSSALNDLYNNDKAINRYSWNNNTTNYAKKIINNKKNLFDKFFGQENMKDYLSSPFKVEYEGEGTINMMSLDMVKIIGQKLNKIDNLIYINANRIIKNWNGDFKRGRPKNIDITHEYCDTLSQYIPKERLVDLRKWSEKEIKRYTCDNMHLTDEGNQWIYQEVLKIIEDKSNQYISSFKRANNLYRSKNYLEALLIYLEIAENSEWVLYKQSVFNSYFKARECGISIPNEIIQRLKQMI